MATKAKVGDKIRILNGVYDGGDIPEIVEVATLNQGNVGIVGFKDPNREGVTLAILEENYEVVETGERKSKNCIVLDEFSTPKGMRQFLTGATRDTDTNKPDYEGFLSPLVIERYGQYMNKHRKQSDGNLRDSDNWQKGFGDDHYGVCIKSLFRHFMDLWLLHRGFKGREDIEESLMAIIFNASAYAHQLLKDKVKLRKEQK